MLKIDFTMTATCRPSIVRRTLTSFSERLTGINLKNQTLHLNVDPLPMGADSMEVITTALAFFDDVRVFAPTEPSFPAAVKWCWQQPLTPYFFHLEDDWVLLEKFYFQTLLSKLTMMPWLSCVNLRAYDFPADDPRICLSPCLMRAQDAGIMASRLTLNANPEKQLRPKSPINLHGGRHGSFESRTIPAHPILQDIGRKWLDGTGYQKDADSPDKSQWTSWRRR